MPDKNFLVKSAEKSWLSLVSWLQNIVFILNFKYLMNFIIKLFEKYECIFIEKVTADNHVLWHCQYLIRTLYIKLQCAWYLHFLYIQMQLFPYFSVVFIFSDSHSEQQLNFYLDKWPVNIYLLYLNKTMPDEIYVLPYWVCTQTIQRAVSIAIVSNWRRKWQII